ncbi:UNVERIFIED_CONTAM: hypothetical protein GTU68_020674 [Idotea baltica]|nr:hypothetical protein [Idotea baltica]
MVCLGLGVGSYFVSTFLWLYVLAYLKLSRAYPLLSVAYILVYLAAIMIPILNETASWEKNLGIVIIIIGVFIVSLPSEAIQDKTT